MKRFYVGFPILALLANAALVHWGRGGFLHHVVAAGDILYVGAPLVCAALVLYIAARMLQRPRLIPPASVVLAVGLTFCSAIASLPPGRAVMANDIQEAKAYCADLVPQIEEYRMNSGEYPPELPPIVRAGEQPYLVRWMGELFYSSSRGSYSFNFWNPGALMGGFM